MKRLLILGFISLFILSFVACNSNSNLSGMSDGEGLDFFLSRIRLDINDKGGYISNNIYVKTVYSKSNQFKSIESSSMYAHVTTGEIDLIDTIGYYNSLDLWETYFTKDDQFMVMMLEGNTRYLNLSKKPDYEIIAGNEKNVLRFPTELNAKKVKFNGLSRFVATLNKDELQDSDWLYDVQIPFIYLYSHIDTFEKFKFKAEFTFQPHGIYNPNYVLQVYCEWRFPLNSDYDYDLYIYSMTTNFYISEPGSIDPTLSNPDQQDVVSFNMPTINHFRGTGEYVKYNASYVENSYFGFFFEPGIYELRNMNQSNIFNYTLYDYQGEIQITENNTFNVYNRGYYFMQINDFIDPLVYYGWFHKIEP